MGYYALKPDVKVIAPWREWDLLSRTKLLAYADANNIPVPNSKRGGEPPFSTDANLLHISYEGNALEDPWVEPAESMFTRSVSPEKAPDKPTYIEIDFEKGDPVALNGKKLSPASLLTALNKVCGDNGIGRVDIVESRFVGMKSRGVYETPGGTALLVAHRAIESITLDRGQSHLKARRARGATTEGAAGAGSRVCLLSLAAGLFLVSPPLAWDPLIPLTLFVPLAPSPFPTAPLHSVAAQDELTPRYAELVYNGMWFTPERVMLQAAVDDSQKYVEGTVRLKLYKGNVIVVGRKSKYSLYNQNISTFEEDTVYDQKDAGGFIKLQALRLRTLSTVRGTPI